MSHTGTFPDGLHTYRLPAADVMVERVGVAVFVTFDAERFELDAKSARLLGQVLHRAGSVAMQEAEEP